MALHTELPIYKVAYDLFDISTDLAKNMPRDFKASIGGKLRDECVDIVTLIFRANVAQDKTILQPIERGIDFVGHVLKPWHRATRRRTVGDALRRVAVTPEEDFLAVANSYFGLLRQAQHSHHSRARLANVVRRRGRCVKGDLTKTYRRT